MTRSETSSTLTFLISSPVSVDKHRQANEVILNYVDDQVQVLGQQIQPSGNHILYGHSDPTDDIGVDGDYYINSTSYFLYGPKQAGVWPFGTSLIGPKGLKGDKGDKGDTGPAGLQGAQGPQGLQGAKGDKGDKGDPGTAGAPGPAGKDGTSVTIKGKFDSTAQLPVSATNGDGYLVSGHLYVYTDGVWNDVGLIQGPKGDTGATGPAGTQGIQGLKGDKGDPGAIGPQGPAGAQGPQGIQGIQGPQGPAGSNALLTPYYYTATGGETSITDTNVLNNKKIIGVFRQSGFCVEVQTAPATEREFKYTAASSKIDFATTTPLNPGEPVLIQYSNLP